LVFQALDVRLPCIFGPSCWVRSLIRPGPGRAILYADWEAQEYGIAAALSRDPVMQEHYASGDPYLAFAKRVGAVPPTATKATHRAERDLFKVCCGLGAMYGAGKHTLASRLGVTPAYAQELLTAHRHTYRRFWAWADAVEASAMLRGYLTTVFGWRRHVGRNDNPRSLRNFMVQANAAEMLRVACFLLTERGILVCGPVHDAVVVEGEADKVGGLTRETEQAMRDASEAVLKGFTLRTEVKTVRHPDRFSDPRGVQMWATVMQILEKVEQERDSAEAADEIPP
jgi:DNA polymerase I-like protein with 3'-5' exonuclease and polymerase domains